MARYSGICAVLALLAAASQVQALSFRFATDPIKVNASPGQVVNRTFWLVLDREEKPTHFRAHVEDWWRSEDGRQSFYRPPGTLARSCANWVKLNPVEAAVRGGETLNVRVTIAIPEEAKPGGYWCVLTVDEVPDPLLNPPGVGVRFATSVSVGIFVYIAPLDQRARITAIEVLPDRAAVSVRNEGNCPTAVEGRFEFRRPGVEEPVATVAVPRGTVLPEPINTSVLSVKLPAAQTLPSGRYLVRVILDTGLEHYIGAQKELDLKRDVPHDAAGN